jgi:hypothetical protein
MRNRDRPEKNSERSSTGAGGGNVDGSAAKLRLRVLKLARKSVNINAREWRIKN